MTDAYWTKPKPSKAARNFKPDGSERGNWKLPSPATFPEHTVPIPSTLNTARLVCIPAACALRPLSFPVSGGGLCITVSMPPLSA